MPSLQQFQAYLITIVAATASSVLSVIQKAKEANQRSSVRHAKGIIWPVMISRKTGPFSPIKIVSYQFVDEISFMYLLYLRRHDKLQWQVACPSCALVSHSRRLEVYQREGRRQQRILISARHVSMLTSLIWKFTTFFRRWLSYHIFVFPIKRMHF
jgi:hypothetical protein